MKIGPYPLREWGWLWIVVGIFWPTVTWLADGARPPAALFVASIIAVVFGVIVAPAIKRIALKDGIK